MLWAPQGSHRERERVREREREIEIEIEIKKYRDVSMQFTVKVGGS